VLELLTAIAIFAVLLGVLTRTRVGLIIQASLTHSHMEISLGRFEQAKSDLQQAIRLSPRDPLIGLWQVELSDVEIAAGNIKASSDQYRKAFDGGYRAYWVYANLAAAYALDGRMASGPPASCRSSRP
jgi:tetratricopeptide (TPR) repeat protein